MATVSRSGGPDDEREVLGHPLCGPRRILGDVEEVAKVGDEHLIDRIQQRREKAP
jgi:hypothetical protein